MTARTLAAPAPLSICSAVITLGGGKRDGRVYPEGGRGRASDVASIFRLQMTDNGLSCLHESKASPSLRAKRSNPRLHLSKAIHVDFDLGEVDCFASLAMTVLLFHTDEHGKIGVKP